MFAFIGASDVVTRILWAAAIIAMGLLLYRVFNNALLIRARQSVKDKSGLPGLPGDRPSILYFTTPECVACKTIQRPALQRVQERMGSRLRVIEIDAHERPDLASRWGVLSVPTTFILDRNGDPQTVNHGATRADKLVQQVEKVL